MHRPDYLMDPAETAGALDGLKAEGKTKHVGVSNFSPSRYHLLASKLKAPIVTNQVEFSPVHLAPISNGTFDTAIIEGHRPMIWSPIGGGKLMTGTDEQTVKIREVLAGIAKRNGLAGPAEAAIAFVVRHPVEECPDHRQQQARPHGRCDQGREHRARPHGLVRGGDRDQPDARAVTSTVVLPAAPGLYLVNGPWRA